MHPAPSGCPLKIPSFKLPSQNARLVMGNSSFVPTGFLTRVFCCTPRTASVEGVLYAFGQMWVLVLEVVSARWPVPGWGSHAGSHGPDPGLAGHKETLQAAGDTWACVKAKPKPENIPPTPPAISRQRVFCLGGRPPCLHCCVSGLSWV